eukprot:CAMPEP_0182459028 /NCGR_PEP_ID=MMETSP1319-20130603/4252_1 /TAXON_ID=172717 /ORGANISM="Bolidomonas pacifica, Strain RCC208" /LENGTH=87 /DNA_ID=CAMNT_0024657853 /DNA_START=10 /DNA_END=270 /DNA_ORIENTATION=-
MKTASTAIAAVTQKYDTAGRSIIDPMEKARKSVTEVKVIDPPTSPRAFPTLSSTASETGSLSKASVRMNMSSIPTPMIMKMHIMLIW